MARETWPCSDDTALARRDSFSASTVMQNVSPGSSARVRPSPMKRSARQAQRLRERAEVLVDERGGKSIVPGRHRCVRGEDDLRSDPPHRFPRVDSFRLHPLADQFERGERTVPLVQVDDTRRDSERRERSDAANAKQQFLTDPHAIVAAVQPRRQLAILGPIPLHVRVEEQQRAASHRQLPHARRNGAGPGVDRRR